MVMNPMLESAKNHLKQIQEKGFLHHFAKTPHGLVILCIYLRRPVTVGNVSHICLVMNPMVQPVKKNRPTTHQKSRINSIKSWEWAKPLAAKKLTQLLVNQTVKKSH